MKNLILILLVIGIQNSAYAANSALNKIVGKLGLVRGEVLLNDREVKSGADVREGATIEVKNGQATLLLGQGSVIHLASESKMVVTQFGVSPAGEEGGNLDLKFGRTRALILNQGSEKKDIKIKARSATMGVRGTEIFINAPRESSKPVEFFTLEGKAVVQSAGESAPTVVNQNQGVLAAGGPSQPGGTQTVSNPVTSEQVRTQIQSAGMAPPPIQNVQDANTVASGQPLTGTTTSQLPAQTSIGNGFLTDQFGTGNLPQIVFDPLNDAPRPTTLIPQFNSVGN